MDWRAELRDGDSPNWMFWTRTFSKIWSIFKLFFRPKQTSLSVSKWFWKRKICSCFYDRWFLADFSSTFAEKNTVSTGFLDHLFIWFLTISCWQHSIPKQRQILTTQPSVILSGVKARGVFVSPSILENMYSENWHVFLLRSRYYLLINWKYCIKCYLWFMNLAAFYFPNHISVLWLQA